MATNHSGLRQSLGVHAPDKTKPGPKGFADLGPELPSSEDFLKGKALLQSMHGGGPQMHDEGRESDPTTGTLYEHMVSLVKLILETQPTHALDQFEELSRQVKRERGGGAGGSGAGAGLVIEDIEAVAPTAKEPSPDYLCAKIERTLLNHPKHKWDESPYTESPLPAPWGGYYDDDDEIARLQNLGQTSFLVEQAGAGLGRTEMMRVWLSIRKLSLKLTTVAKLRFWGKILGTSGAYYIAEGESEAGMDPDNGVPAPFDEWRPYPEEEPEEARQPDTSELSEEKIPEDVPDIERMLDEARKVMLEKLPKNKWCPKAPIPPEPRGKGTNRWDYFVCTNLGTEEWFRLPPARPEHIHHARFMRHLFVGKPDAPVARLPGALGDFPGLEVHLLRAQIARITAATWISPAGLYEIDEEAELEEGVSDRLELGKLEQPETLMEVEEFEPPQFEELLDPANWQHTRPYILPQGRCSYVNQQRAAAALEEALGDPQEKRWINPDVAKLWQKKIEARAQNEEEEMEEEGEKNEEIENPEEGPGLLGTIEEDAVLLPVGDVGQPKGRATKPKSSQMKLTSRPLTAWRVHPSTVLLPKNCSVAIVSSGRWPGAYTLARGGDFVNIYVGWGNKSLAGPFSPLKLEKQMTEFDEEAVTLIETMDPTPLEEEAVRAAKEARRLAREAKAEEEEEEEGAEEEEED